MISAFGIEHNVSKTAPRYVKEVAMRAVMAGGYKPTTAAHITHRSESWRHGNVARRAKSIAEADDHIVAGKAMADARRISLRAYDPEPSIASMHRENALKYRKKRLEIQSAKKFADNEMWRLKKITGGKK